jgi:hypothetical protein
MTMNSSGQISLGGSTAGQSINLEILQSATASVSLNTSAVRALAAIPTGAISISSVYGKTYTRYGTVTASFTRSTGKVDMAITGGQPNTQFYVYLYYSGSGQPYPGYIAPDYPATNTIGTLDSSGNWTKQYSVSGDSYWYYGAWYNRFYFYQASTGQSFPSDPYNASGGPLGTLLADVSLYTG